MQSGKIYIGSSHIYNKESCDGKKLRLSEALKKLENEIRKTGIEVIKPLVKEKNDMCMSLWVRDSSLTIDNKVYLMPQMINNKIRSKQIKSEVDVIPYKNEGKRIPSDVNLDGGDIIIDGETIYVGKGGRTDDSGVKYLKGEFPNKEIIVISHHGLHLDCCFGVLPGNNILYSSTYIKRFPSKLREKYNIYRVEDYINDRHDTNLSTNFLLIGETVITAYKKKFEKIYKLIEELGLVVRTIPFENIFMGGGGVRCMTQWYKMPKNQKIF
jgi:N-dimethylarginine dimethylaminohydrolase|tara:strand:- start:2137 stop:2943 length:807 start_codon:yes stop_codon:yes gene_type:complete